MYDETSRLKELKVDNQIQMNEIVYNPLNQVTQLKTGAATNNADIEQYSYDNQTGLLTNQKVVKANSNQTLSDLSYEYNRGQSNGTLNGKTGQLTHIVDNLNRNRDRVYEFDALGRLRTAKGGGATGAPNVTANWTQQYAYDRYGNRTNVTANGITQNNQLVPTDGLSNQSYDQTSNRITTAGYVYDLAGNLTRGQDAAGNWHICEYDAAGRLVKVKDDAGNEKLTNAYSSSRQRIASQEGGSSSSWTWYVWGGSSVIAEYKSNTWGNDPLVWQKSYIYAGSRLLSTYTNNGSGGETQEFHHPDRLGTRLVTNNQANTSFEQSTLPFGTSLDAETTGTTNQRFTSYDRSTVTGIDYAVNRSYSSAQGRFTSVDPIGMSATSLGNPQSMNLYAYVGNNPVDFVDPTGLMLIAICYDREWVTWDKNEENIPTIHYSRECIIIDTGGVGGNINPRQPEEPGGGGGVPNKGVIDEIINKKVAGQQETCRQFLDKVLNQLRPGATVDSVYGDIKGGIRINPKMKWSQKNENKGRTGYSFFDGKNNRAIDLAAYPAEGKFTDKEVEQKYSDYYYTKTIVHELFHHATGKTGKLFDHSDIAEAITLATGEVKPDGMSDSKFINEQIRKYCNYLKQ